MASKQSVADFLVEQMADAGPVAARKMFGEYGVFMGPKLVALVADDELFIKPTSPGEALLGEVELRPPYPGAKGWMWISGDRWDDRDWLSELVRITADALPVPPPKKPKAAKKAKAEKPAAKKPAAKKSATKQHRTRS
ncbi:MAG: TfoX/Sxy family protein [Deltaproteobacteria bacterium]|nr:TfoX/Sxy family protein [Deltaproteobacteria bacterium]